ncbi:MAG: hypothetical protein Q9174_002156 [Haloplaca sp. 1 TL-2023]
MPHLLRRKFTCFYCNRRSAQDRKADIRQWQCEQCEAVNYLDENGEITDPPAQEVVSLSHVQPQSWSQLRTSTSPNGALFCDRCLQNQHIVNQALAEYLPASDNPRYHEFERALPAYRRKMEDRFPQVCELCAPRVEDRIRESGYAAKADNVRRVMDRTRLGSRPRQWTWKTFAVQLGAIGWFSALATYLSWHILEALPQHQVEEGLVDEDAMTLGMSSLIFGASGSWFTRSCNGVLQPLLAYAFGISIICCWWNPRMQYKQRGGLGRIVGSAEYYKLQLLILAARYLSWKLGAKDSPIAKDIQTLRAIHALSFVFEFLLAILSFRSIQIDQTPLVTFQEDYEPLMRARSPTRSDTILHQGQRIPSPLPKPRIDASFVEKLAPRTPQPTYQSPTPPPEENETGQDSPMDWTPQHEFRPATAYHAPQARPVFDGPSPFHGVIPPAPVSWAQRLRNPPNQPTFRKASETKKESLFPSRATKRVISDTVSEASTQFSPVSRRDMQSETVSPVKFADPRFFAPGDTKDTGLESLFRDTFSLDRRLAEDFPPDQWQDPWKPSSHIIRNPSTHFLLGGLLAASCVAWDYASTVVPNYELHVRTSILGLAAMISLYQLRSFLTVGRFGSAGTQICGLLASAYIVWRLTINSDNEDSERVSAFGLWYLIASMIWVAWDMVSSLAVPADSASESGALQPEHQEQLPQEPPLHVAQRAPKATVSRAPTVTNSTITATTAKPNTIALTQRTTRSRSKAQNQNKRDSLGDGLDSLSIGGW